MVSDFPSYVATLQKHYGSQAVAVRHELFFLGQRRFPAGRAALALLRDAVQLVAQREMPLPDAESLAVLVATLPGSAGWDTLARALGPIRRAGLRPVVLAHPRLDSGLFPKEIDVRRPGRPAANVLAASLAAAAGGTVAATVARRRLWAAGLARVLERRRGWLILHNDFDMMSAASLGLGWPSICLQHGIPTDEFFPVRADRHLVWGASSADAFARAGVDRDALAEDALGRAAPPFPAPAGPPGGLALLSQGHAAILGPGLPSALRRFAQGLEREAPGSLVLLHPREMGRPHPYGGLPALAICEPPHALLRGGEGDLHLVVGYCSTAMLDAAIAGHWVAGLELDLTGNAAARSVAVPPLRVRSAVEAVALVRRLAEDGEFRARAAAGQCRWLADTFAAEAGELERLLREGREA